MNKKTKSTLIGAVGGIILGGYTDDCIRRQKVLNQAREYCKQTGKKLLNLSCGSTDFGDVNADITQQNVKNFVLYKPDVPLPFEDKEFGAVYCAHTLEHVDNPIWLLDELNRVSDKIFVVLPEWYQVGYFLPTHKWLPLDQTGTKWIKNPFYSKQISEKKTDWSRNPFVK